VNRNLVIRILFICLGILLIAYFAFNRQNSKRYLWTESYKASSSQPYGTMFVQKLLASYRSNQKFIFNDKTPLHKLLDTTRIKTKTDYVFIGYGIYLVGEDVRALQNFIYSGNDAFIAAVDLPFGVLNSVFVNECDREIVLDEKDTVSTTFNFYNEALKTKKGYTYAYRFGKVDFPYYWNAVNSEVFCDSVKSTIPIGYSYPNKVNFFRIPYGKGNLYVHTNPLVFTNYFLVKPDKVEYASSVFSHLHGQSIIWDEFSKSELTPRNAPKVNPMSYILQQDSLRYAWWLILLAALLYTLFTAKRKQQVIPVLEGKSNTSLEFINTIAALHFQNGNHRDIAKKRMKYFFYLIKAKYGMHIQNLTEPFMQRLSEKSTVELNDLKSIEHEFNRVDKHRYYDESMLVDLQVALEKFYKHSK
jgi:hypothetical protein